ncbi:universal stress protein [Olivibacter sp. SDN3]|uniref:universal stress protein n=1 Tax=Olivibacter sp. SDN3 TaxID=2764720 RepID=UPI00165146CB|nr:universal stress protein [Olivibacter sp. SDN3]QNL52166.1 universal stress protein [Olivibacter sp. SDN3]
MIQSILVPTDFSKNAGLALRYALAIARRFDCRVHVMHAFTAFQSSFQNEASNREDLIRAEQEATAEMDSFLKTETTENLAVYISSSLFKGNIVEAVTQAVNTTGSDLIIMGTKGASGLKHTLIGSSSFEVAGSSPVPLIVVPEETQNFRLEQIAFLTDYANSDISALKTLKNLFGSTKSSYRFFHMKLSEEDSSEIDQRILAEWVQSLKKIVPLDNVSHELVQGEESLTLVNEIAERNSIDLLVITIRKKNFFEKLFQKNLVKAIIHQSKTPVLIL